MKPIVFTSGMGLLRGGDKHDDLPVLPVRIEGAGPALISCWQLSFRDLVGLLTGRLRVYVTVLSTIHPPILLATGWDRVYGAEVCEGQEARSQ